MNEQGTQPELRTGYWTQRQAAVYLNVSARYLRDSDCPKIQLPGNGPKRQSIIRYKPAEVIAWAESWGTVPHRPRAA